MPNPFRPLVPLAALSLFVLPFGCASDGGGDRETLTGMPDETPAEAAGEDIGIEVTNSLSEINEANMNEDPTFDNPAVP